MRTILGVSCATVAVCACAELTVIKVPGIPVWVGVIVVAVATAVAAAGSSKITEVVAGWLSPRRNNVLRRHYEAGPDGRGPGRVRQAAAVFLGVHAAETLDGDPTDFLPAYVRRDAHDRLEAAVRSGGFVVIEGRSASGKTRLAFEVMRAAIPDHLLLLPHGGQALAELGDAGGAPRRSVVFLDNLERFTSDGAVDWGLIELLCLRSTQRTIFATLRPDALKSTQSPPVSADAISIPDPLVEICGHSRTVLVRLEDTLSEVELERAIAVGASDTRIAAAVKKNLLGFGAQLCGGIALLARWRAAQAGRNPLGAAVIQAAVDCRRAGLVGPLPRPLLDRLFCLYLADSDRAAPEYANPLPGYMWASESLCGLRSLIPRSGESYDVEDYLLDAVQSAVGGPPVPHDCWRTIIEYTSRDGATQFAVGNAALRAGRQEFAMTAWRGAAAAGQVKAVTNLGLLLSKTGHVPEAVTTFRRAAAAGEPRAMSLLGWHLMDSGHFVVAERWLRRSARLGESAAFFNLAILLEKKGEDQKAEEYYRMAVSAAEYGAALNLGILLCRSSRLVEAEQFYRLGAAEGDAVAMFNLGCILDERGCEGEARVFYQSAVEHGHVPAMNNLGGLEDRRGDSKRAEELYRAAASERDRTAMYNLGLQMMQQGRYQESEEWWIRSAELGYTHAFLRLGDLMTHLDRHDEATTWYGKAKNASR
jgi:TPR repeat protein